ERPPAQMEIAWQLTEISALEAPLQEIRTRNTTSMDGDDASERRFSQHATIALRGMESYAPLDFWAK
ncbi:MAG: hypothetical protein ACREC9_17010, partial [Methylocella sp.]